MKLRLAIATPNDAPQIASLLSETAQHLTSVYGEGHWSYQSTEKGVLFGMKGNVKVLLARQDKIIVGSLRLTTKKPWAIDTAYFTRVHQPLYLVDMAVKPDLQRTGIGRYMLQEVTSFAKSWPAQAVRLDAYDTPAGAGEFYRKCGYRERGHVIYKGTPLIYFELML